MKFGYYAIESAEYSGGVVNKLQGVVSAFQKFGYLSHLCLVKCSTGLFSFVKYALAISSAKEDILFVRGISYGYLLITPAILIARLRRRKVYLDVPTPQMVAFYEILSANQGFLIKTVKCFLLLITGPIAFWPANVVIQYAPEGKFFTFGNKNKIRLIGNGIALDTVVIRDSEPSWPSSAIHLLGVANVSEWHGYDRIIKGMAYYRNTQSQPLDILFTIVGSGPAIADLKELCKELNLSDKVIFTGSLHGKELNREYCKAHLAIDAIGIHRKGMSVASTLKSREYCAIGIPFFSSYKDYDFDGDEPFRYCVSQTDNYQEIATLFADIFSKKSLPCKEEIRDFAEKRLSWSSKLEQLGVQKDK